MITDRPPITSAVYRRRYAINQQTRKKASALTNGAFLRCVVIVDSGQNKRNFLPLHIGVAVLKEIADALQRGWANT